MNHLHQFSLLQQQLTAINSAQCVLSWDQETQMPPKGAVQRAKTMAYLAGHSHSLLTSDETQELVCSVENDSSVDETTGFAIKQFRYDVDRAKKIPNELIHEMEEHGANAYHAWVEARKSSDFSIFAPLLEKQVALHQQYAKCVGFDDSPYDALLEGHEKGMKTKDVDRLFAEATPRLKQLVSDLVPRFAEVNDDFRWESYDTDKQHSFILDVMKKMGYDFEGGRVDRAVHPFMIGIAHGDVRVTFRNNEKNLFEGIYALLHETGHALYEQGFDERFAQTILYSACSTAVHESQSRTWENIIGRDSRFWDSLYPSLQTMFPERLSAVSQQAFVLAANKVTPHFIRIESDELTYCFHIFLRFIVEKELIEGTLSVHDVPSRWNGLMQEYLGIVPSNDAEGCLQDVHWAHGMGYFSTYVLGNFYGAQFMEKAESDLPNLWSSISSGDFLALREWQREHIHKKCNLFEPMQLVKEVTGNELSALPFVTYLEQKYKQLLE